jgi:hypothetical protein
MKTPNLLFWFLLAIAIFGTAVNDFHWLLTVAIWCIVVAVLADQTLSGIWYIPKGFHHSINLPTPFVRSRMGYAVTFPDSCRYIFPYPVGSSQKEGLNPDQKDWNKLFGFCFGLNRHRNSVRIGWRYNPIVEQIELGMYSYRDGVRNMSEIGSVPIGTPIWVYVDVRDWDEKTVLATIQLNDQKKAQTFLSKSSAIRFRLKPYFGGQEKAPKPIIIEKSKLA